jgi:hypothetical protein
LFALVRVVAPGPQPLVDCSLALTTRSAEAYPSRTTIATDVQPRRFIISFVLTPVVANMIAVR